MTGRADARPVNELRPVRVTRDYLKHPMGSCLFELGHTRVLCAASVAEGVSAWRRGSGLGWVTAEYSMLPASTHTRSRREMSGPKGRTHEIQRLIGRSLRSVIDLGALGGEVTVTVDCDVIQADGGTRCAAITGAWLAVNDAFERWREAGKMSGNPLTEHVAATSVGMIDGELRLDLDYAEDSIAEVDMNVVMDGRERFIEVQGTGEQVPFDRQRLNEMLDLAAVGIYGLLAVQRQLVESGERSYGF